MIAITEPRRCYRCQRSGVLPLPRDPTEQELAHLATGAVSQTCYGMHGTRLGRDRRIPDRGTIRRSARHTIVAMGLARVHERERTPFPQPQLRGTRV